MNQQSPQRGSILSLAIKDKAALHATYMPFLRNGGIFMPTTRNCELGSQVFLLLALPDESEALAVNGRVAWITPAHAQGNRASGIGIQFQDASGMTRKKIEHVLDGYLSSEQLTHTM